VQGEKAEKKISNSMTHNILTSMELNLLSI
jgi:hypothetical protein